MNDAREREENAKDDMSENSDPKDDVKVIKLNLKVVEDIWEKISYIANEIAEEVQDIRKEEERVQEDINKSEQKIRDKVSTERLLEYINLLIDVNPKEQYKRSRAHKYDTWEKK